VANFLSGFIKDVIGGVIDGLTRRTPKSRKTAAGKKAEVRPAAPKPSAAERKAADAVARKKTPARSKAARVARKVTKTKRTTR